MSQYAEQSQKASPIQIEKEVPVNNSIRTNDKPSGFSGWLILPLLTVISNPITSLYNTIAIYRDHYKPNTWWSLTNPASADYNILWRPALIFQLTFGLVIFLLSLLLVYVFFTKKQTAPKIFILVMLVGGISVIGNYIFAKNMHNISPDTLHLRIIGLYRVGIFVGLGIPYMLKSKRVRNTFVS